MQKLIGSIPVSEETAGQKDEDGTHSSFPKRKSLTDIPPLGKVSSLYPSLQKDLEPTSLSEGVPLNSSPEAALIYGGVAVGARYDQPRQRIPETRPNSQERSTAANSPAAATNTANWSTSLQTVLDQPPSTLPRQLILGGLTFCVAFGAWATLGRIDEVGHARGQLVPKGEVYKIHPIESGKIARIRVKEGQSVKAGEELVELDTEIAATEVERLQQMLVADQIQLNQMQSLIARTRLEAQTRAEIAKADAQAAMAAIDEINAKAAATQKQLTELRTAAAASEDRVNRLKPLSGTTQELRQKLEADVAAAVEEVERLKPLVEAGAISKKYLLDAQQVLRDRQSAITKNQLEEVTSTKEREFEAEQALRDRTSAIAANQGELPQTLAQAEQLRAGLLQKQAEGRRTQIEAQQKIQQLEVETTQLKAKIAENQNLLSSAKAKLKQRFLYAPVDGVVSSLNIPNPGEVVQPGQTIAEMAPQNAPLVLSASLPNQEAGFVKIGMPAQVKLDAFPYQDYGMVTGKVLSISSDAKPDERLGAVYRVQVALDRSYVTANHQTIKLKAGQTASAEIIIRRRRIADIILDPIRQLQKGGINL
jgi:HlyD family secretion protein